MENQVWWRSKLVWLGVLEIAVGVAVYISTLEPGTSISVIVAGVLTIVFRIVTKQPLSK